MHQRPVERSTGRFGVSGHPWPRSALLAAYSARRRASLASRFAARSARSMAACRAPSDELHERHMGRMFPRTYLPPLRPGVGYRSRVISDQNRRRPQVPAQTTVMPSPNVASIQAFRARRSAALGTSFLLPPRLARLPDIAKRSGLACGVNLPVYLDALGDGAAVYPAGAVALFTNLVGVIEPAAAVAALAELAVIHRCRPSRPPRAGTTRGHPERAR